jgi:hypothetical protein
MVDGYRRGLRGYIQTRSQSDSRSRPLQVSSAQLLFLLSAAREILRRALASACELRRPGPGFVGPYDFVFVLDDGTERPLRIVLRPTRGR